MKAMIRPRRSIREKLVTIVMSTTLAALAVSVGTVVAYDLRSYKSALLNDLSTQAELVGHMTSAALAFEVQKASGADKGIYLELGVNPAVPMKDGAPVAITIPVKVGLGLKDYYFNADGDTPFGYFSAGVSLSHALAHGDVHGSVIAYGFGDALKAVNNDKAGQVVGSVGFTVTF